MSIHIARLGHAFHTTLADLGFADPFQAIGLEECDDDRTAIPPLSYAAGYATATRDQTKLLADVGNEQSRTRYLAASNRAACVSGVLSFLIILLHEGVSGDDLGRAVDLSIQMMTESLSEGDTEETSLQANLA